MRHRSDYRKLGRTSSHRLNLLRNLSISLITYGKIQTSLIKAKELSSYIERLVSIAKVGDSSSHRRIFAKLQNKNATKKLVDDIAPKYKNTNGGYTSIHRTQIRRGDACQMSVIKFVE